MGGRALPAAFRCRERRPALRQLVLQCCGFTSRQDHLLHDGQALFLEEHMLGAAEADSLGAEAQCPLGVPGVVGVGPHAEMPKLVGPGQQLL